MWALITRSDPATSIDIIHNAWSTPLDPRIEPERKAKGDNTNSRAIIDACRPWHWRDKFPRVNMPSPEKARTYGVVAGGPRILIVAGAQKAVEDAGRELDSSLERLRLVSLLFLFMNLTLFVMQILNAYAGMQG